MPLSTGFLHVQRSVMFLVSGQGLCVFRGGGSIPTGSSFASSPDAAGCLVCVVLGASPIGVCFPVGALALGAEVLMSCFSMGLPVLLDAAGLA